MFDEEQEIIFPEENEFRLKEEVFWKVSRLIKFPEFEKKNKIFLLIATLLKAVIVLSISILAYKVKDEPDELAACVATCPIIFMAVLKLFYMYIQTKRVRYLLDNVHEEFWDLRIAGPQVEKRIRRRFFIINIIIIVNLFSGIFCVLFLNVYPVMEMPEGVKPLPNAIWTPFDTNPTPLHEILVVFLIWNQLFTVFGNGFYDYAYISSIQHLCAQLSLLKELLRNITVGLMPYDSDLEKYNSEYIQNEVMSRLKICVKHHCKLLKYGKNIDKYMSTILIPQLIMTYMALVVNGYILTSTGIVSLHNLELLTFTFAIFTEFVLLAVQASDLKDQSLSIINAVTMSEWYLFKAPIKRALVFLILNAERGIVITVGGMINVNNPLIISILHKVFSAITLLKALIIEEDL